MPAASLTGTKIRSVLSQLRVVTGIVTAMGNGDTLTVPGIKKILFIDLAATSNSSHGFTISGNVATLVSGGALTGLIFAIGE